MLDQDITYLPGVGPHRKEILSKELNIHTFGDLLEYYPYKYVDRSRLYRIADLQGTQPFVQIKGQILSFEEFVMGVRKKRIVAHFTDGTGIVDLVSVYQIRRHHLQSQYRLHRFRQAQPLWR